MKTISITLLALLSALPLFAYTDEDIIASTLILEAGGEYAEGSMEAVYEGHMQSSMEARYDTARSLLATHAV